MMKPSCKGEAWWLHWRNDFPGYRRLKGFTKWSKRKMNKAKRRYFGRILKKGEYDKI
jgi:hypothetical protein